MTDSASSTVRHAGVPQGLTVVIAAFLPLLAIVSLFPAVPSIIDHFHADPTASWKVPWMVTAPGLAIALIAPFAGVIVDRFGRRAFVVWSTFFYALVGSAPFFLTSLNALFVSRVFLGVAEAAILTTLNTLIADYWDEQGRRHWLTLQGIMGPFLGSGLILASGYLTAIRWNGVFLIYLVAFPIFLAMLAFLFEPTTHARRNSGIDGDAQDSRFPTAIVTAIGAVTLFCAVIYYVYTVNGGLAFREVGVQSSEELGRITALPSLFVAVGAGLFWLTGKGRSELCFAILLALIGIGYVAIGVAPDWKWMIAGVLIQQAGTGMLIPTLIVWAQRQLPVQHRGKGMGVWTACFFLGQFISPPIVTIIKTVIGSMQGAFAAAGVAGIIGSVVAIVLLFRRNQATQAALAG